MRRLLWAFAPFLLAGCVAVPQTGGQPQRPTTGPSQTMPPAALPPVKPPPPAVAGFRAPQILHESGLEEVIEQPAERLIRRFGQPRLDVKEGDMRKLQFAGQACVLDVFLYPLREGAAPVATHVEARRGQDGQAVNRASCANALARR